MLMSFETFTAGVQKAHRLGLQPHLSNQNRSFLTGNQNSTDQGRRPHTLPCNYLHFASLHPPNQAKFQTSKNDGNPTEALFIGFPKRCPEALNVNKFSSHLI